MLAVVGGTLLPTVLDGLVALLGPDDAPVCSGILVAPDRVLTAAHCFEEGQDPVAVALGTDATRPAQVVAVTRVVVHPEYAGDAGADLAVLSLDGDLPGRWFRVSEEGVALGEEVSVSGFGATGDGVDDAGIKRGATLQVVASDVDTLLAFAPGANACSGDSGGPMLLQRGAELHLVALASEVDPTCVGGRTVGTALASRVEWLVAQGLVAGSQPAQGDPAPRSGGCDAGPGWGTGGWVGLLLVRWIRRRPGGGGVRGQ